MVNGDVIGVAVDVEANTVEFFVDGVSQGVLNPDAQLAMATPYIKTVLAGESWTVNFGQTPFAYTPPVGYKRFCSQDMPPLLIPEGYKGFDAITYTGDSSNPRAITGLDFQPDLVWIKKRSAIGGHVISDSERGGNKYLNSADDTVEGTFSTFIQSFDSNGFTVGDNNLVNTTAVTYVAWCWKKDPMLGFDIVSYEGNGVATAYPHSLGVVPEMIIVKNRETALDWRVYHQDLDPTYGKNYWLELNSTAARSDVGAVWNDTLPTTSTFTVGAESEVNENLKDHIAYLFASVEGFSKVFSYTGNGIDDGPFVYCGFRPRYVLVKRHDATANWVLWDAVRGTYNAIGPTLIADTTAIETNANYIDLLSNGFKIRVSGIGFNIDLSPVIGIAYAEHPFKYANAR